MLDFAQPFFNFATRYWSHFFSRFANPYHPESIFYFFLFAVMTVAFLVYREGKNWWPALKAKTQNPQQWIDLKFDLCSYLLVAALDCLFIYGLSLSIFSIHVEIQKWAVDSLAHHQSLGLWTLEGAIPQFLLPFYVFLAWDFATYVGHRLHHEIPLLWEFHKFHHNGHSLNPFTAFRVHFFNDIIHNIIVGALLILLCAPFLFLFENAGPLIIYQVGVFHIVFMFIFKHFHHSPFFIRFPNWLSVVFLSPAMHHIHHSTKPQHENKNFAIIFSVWDWLLGTQYLPQENEDIVLGMGAKQKSLLKELIRPFFSLVPRFKNPQGKFPNPEPR